MNHQDIKPIYFVFDIETYPNIFTFTGKFRGLPEIYTFEISARKNQRDQLLWFLDYLKNIKAINVGFNSIGFDYYIIHQLLASPYTFDNNKAYQICQQIINSGAQRFAFNIHHKNRNLEQLDLYLLNHFDNANKKCGLKALEFAMRSQSVEDLPFPPGTILTNEQMDLLIKYNIHDVTETEKFLEICMPAVQMRLDLISDGTLTGDVLNYNDVKIGEKYLVNKIGRSKCYSGSKPKQSIRTEINFKSVVLPKIFFRTETCNEVLQWFKDIIVYPLREEKTKAPKKKINFGGIEYVFGLGGVHASVESKIFHSNDEYVIKDVDVSGMYPAVAVANRFAPEHLGESFVINYAQLPIERKQYKKGTTKNKVFKLSSNGAFGKMIDPYSCFYDPKCGYSVTVNGQLQALQLAEKFCEIPGLQIIQANTDGITAYIPRRHLWMFEVHKADWQKETGLELEEVEYKSMFIRDVNNYIAVKSHGETKLKGAYWYPKSIDDYEGNWSKDYSMLVVQKCAEAMIVRDENPEAFIYLNKDKFDFMKRYKANGESKVYIGNTLVSKTVRYYVSTKGEPMRKVDPPRGPEGHFKRKNGLSDSQYTSILSSIPAGTWDSRIHTSNRSVYQEVITSIESGKLVKVCNNADDFDWSDLDWDYYIKEVLKLEIR